MFFTIGESDIDSNVPVKTCYCRGEATDIVAKGLDISFFLNILFISRIFFSGFSSMK